MSQNLFLGLKAWQIFMPAAGVADNTTAGRFDPTYCDSSVTSPLGGTLKMRFTDDDNVPTSAVAGDVLEARFDLHITVSNITPMVRFENAAQQELLRLNLSFDNNLQLQHNTGTLASPSWTNVGAPVSAVMASNSRQTLNIKLTIGLDNNHNFKFYRNNELFIDANFTNTLLTELQFLVIRASGNGGSQFGLSQVFVAKNKDLLGSFVACLAATGAGSNSGMTGAFTDVNKAVENDTSLVSSDTAAQRTTFAFADLPALPVDTVVGGPSRHTFRCRATGSPSNIRSVIRQAGVDTVSGNVAGIDAGFLPLHVSYSLTEAQINAAGFELGWESAA